MRPETLERISYKCFYDFVTRTAARATIYLTQKEYYIESRPALADNTWTYLTLTFHNIKGIILLKRHR